MTYVVTDACVKCKYTDCVEVCPVDCFHEHKNMVVINPETCIDCGVCELECPVSAIKPGSEELLVWIERAKQMSQNLPQITTRKNPLPEADLHSNEKNKYEKYMEG